MPESASLPPWARIALVALALFAIFRGVALVRHDPLLALANNYDQIRYSACLPLAALFHRGLFHRALAEPRA